MKSEPVKKRCRETSCRKLLEAGADVFSEMGYDCATTKQVAQRAGVNESLITRYFDGKAGLLLAIIQQFAECEEQETAMLGFPKGQTLQEELVNYFKATLDHYEENKAFMRVLLSRAMVDTQIGQELNKQMHRKGGIQRLASDLKEFQSKGLIRPEVDIEQTAFSIRGQAFAQGFISLIVLGIDRKTVLKNLVEFSANFSEGLLR
jgi:AcrR family transcriptional regulator